MTWTKVPNPSNTDQVVSAAGSPIGLLLALTYATSTVITNDPWTDVNTSQTGGWTSVAVNN